MRYYYLIQIVLDFFSRIGLAILIISSFCFFQFCKRTNLVSIPTDKLIELKVTLPDKFIEYYSSIFSSIEKIELETNDSCLIGEISSLRIVENDIYIIQQTGSTKTLLRFDKNGSFLNRIGSYGRGPKEILDPRDFYIENNYIEIWSRLNISQFTKQGEFVQKKFDAFYPGVGFFKSNEDYFLFHSAANPFRVSKISSKGKVLEQYFPYKYFDAISGNDKIVYFNNEIILFSAIIDTIYEFKNGNFYPKAYFEYEKMSSASAALKKSKNPLEFINELNNNKENCSIINYFENIDYIFFEFLFDKERIFCLFDKSNFEAIYFNSSIEDNYFGTPFMDPIYLTEEDALVIPVYSKQFHQEGTINKADTSISKQYSNPLLLFCKLKLIGNEKN